MTFGCARCHDHKFDPISTEDYYAMAGIFRSTKVIDVFRKPGGVSEWLEVDVASVATKVEIARLNAETRRLQDTLKSLGASETSRKSGTSQAPRAIVAHDLPKLTSTTWAAWARIREPQKLGAVVSAAYEGADQGHSLGFDSGSTPRVVWNHGKGVHTIIAAARPVKFNEWHHLAVTFDAPAERLRLFVDGDEAASASNVATTHFSMIGVGRREASQQFQFTGDVDDVRVYDVSLSDQDIMGLFRKRSPKPSPVLHWGFDRLSSDRRVAAEQGGIAGRFVGTSFRNRGVDDGAIGRAFSFGDVAEVSPADSDRSLKIADLRNQIAKLEDMTPAVSRVMAAGELSPVDLAVHLRGSHFKLGSTVIARSTPKVFAGRLASVVVPEDENGRLQLANWIANAKNPLTARVMVNRIWQYHFGAGLVRTSSNFGIRGELPIHPELLDWLANEFMNNGWSIKRIHGLIMNSAVYRQSSQVKHRLKNADSENRWLSRFPIRRLEAEAVRDSLLAVTGELDRTVGGSLFDAENKKRVTMSPVDSAYDSHRRSVYLPSVRVRSYQLFSIFDVSDSGQHVALRSQTMVAQQALFLMNNPLVIGRAKELSNQIVRRQTDFIARADWLHQVLYGRPVSDRESSILRTVFRELKSSDTASGQAEDAAELFAWQHIIHTMLCSNEFIHLR